MAGEGWRMDAGRSWVVLAAAFLIFGLVLGQILSFGLYFVDFLGHFGESRAATSAVGTVSYALSCLVGPLSGALQKRFGARRVIMFGGLLASAGMSAAYLAQNLWHLYLSYGCACGIGFGLAMTPALSVIPEYFERYRYFATTFVAVGAATGTLIMAPFTFYIIETYTWRGSMLINAGLCLQIVVLGALVRSRRLQPTADWRALLDTTVLRSGAFLLLFVDALVLGGVSFTVFSLISSFGVERGLTTWQSAELLSVAAFSNMAARAVAAVVAPMRCVDVLVLYAFSTLSCAAGTLSCVFCRGYWCFASCMLLFGLSMGVKFSQPPNVIIQLLGVERLVGAFGYFMFAVGFGGFIIPLVAGWLADKSRTETAFEFAAVFSFIGFLLCIALLVISRRRKREAASLATPDGDDIQVNLKSHELSGDICDNTRL